MKRYGNLHSQICSPENILFAHLNARRGKRHYPAVVKVDGRQDVFLRDLREMLACGDFESGGYEVFVKRGRSKTRLIHKLPYFPDRIVHHCIVQVLEPVWRNVLIRDTYSAIRGRGIHDGARRMMRFLKDVGGTMYCLKMDISKFYPSVNHDILRKILRKKIKCKPTLCLLDNIIFSGQGVPIGNYLSQYFGNLYLAYYDHWIKETHGVKYYSRYCDDMVILDSEKSRLHQLYRVSEKYMREKLNLCINANWRIFPVDSQGVDYLGYVFRHDHVRLRRSIAVQFKRSVSLVRKKYLTMPASSVINSLMSYYGWIRHCNGWNLWSAHIDDTVRQIVKHVCLCNNMTIPRPLRS